MKALIRLTAVTALMLVSACSKNLVANLELSVDTNDVALVEQTEQVIQQRFTAVQSGLSSSFETQVTQNNIALRIYNDMPSEELLLELCCKRNLIAATIIDGERKKPWLTNADFMDLSLGYRGDHQVVKVTLSDEAAMRTLDLTRNNIGKKAEIAIDGEVLMSNTIQGVFSKDFEISLPDGLTGQEFIIKISMQPLPVDVALKSLEY